MIDVKVGGLDAALATLKRVEHAGHDMRPLLKNIGEHLVNTTKQRFLTSTAPDGSKWAPNSQVTYLKLLGDKHMTKANNPNKAGVNRVLSKRPLIQSFALGTEIHWQLVAGGLEVGSTKVYAAMMQFGGKKSEFPNLWGDIPSREFLGVSSDDESAILRMAVDHMAAPIKSD